MDDPEDNGKEPEETGLTSLPSGSLTKEEAKALISQAFTEEEYEKVCTEANKLVQIMRIARWDLNDPKIQVYSVVGALVGMAWASQMTVEELTNAVAVMYAATDLERTH